jgi:beta-1,4-glucosyltransferase
MPMTLTNSATEQLDRPSGIASPKTPSCTLLGVRVDDIAATGVVEFAMNSVASRKRGYVVNSNVHLINQARSNPWLVDLFARAGVAFCDGTGVQFALWMQEGRRFNRHTPPEWIDDLARRLAAGGFTVYWLGGAPDIVASAAARLSRDTGVRSVGFHHGFFDKSAGSQENMAVLSDINTAAPDVLLINFGMPQQERWLHDNWDSLNATVAITAGALVDHVAGVRHRPPRWVADLGLEWAVRLIIEPRRLWRRYLVGLPTFGIRFFRNQLVGFASKW